MTLTLNLRNLFKSDIKYEIINFPDGQTTIRIVDKEYVRDTIDTIHILTSLTSWQDLETLVGANQSLKEMFHKAKIHLFVSYLLGARSDRKFEIGSTNYLKNVIAPVINSQNFASVTVVDPHSDVTEAVIDRCIPSRFEALELTYSAISRRKHTNCILVSPDAGALKRIESIQKNLRVEFDIAIDEIITAHKVRDIETGNILKTHIDILPEQANKTLIVIDDICDGGKTFIELAKAAKATGHKGKMILVVTHGIFSKTPQPILEYYDQIYTTNSYQEFDSSPLIDSDIIVSEVI